MISIPNSVDQAKLLFYTFIDERHQATPAATSPAKILAICQYNYGSDFFLFHCDQDWQNLGESVHRTLDEAKEQAELEYTGSIKTWKTARL